MMPARTEPLVRTLGLLLGVALAAFAGALAHAQLGGSAPPLHTIAYRGYIEDASGPLEAAVDLHFRLFAAASGGSALGAVIDKPDVQVVGGQFSVTLDLSPALLARPELWLEIQVGAQSPLTPRQRLLSQPYAANGAPPGSIMAYAGDTAPPGWLLCDGSLVDRATYPALWAAIQGATWGNGNGTTTFALPDLRGQFLRGARGPAAGPDATPNRAVGNLQGFATARPATAFTTDNDGLHNHELRAGIGDSGNSSLPVNITYGYNNSANTHATNATITSAGQHDHSVAGGGDAETRPTNRAVTYIIKY